MRFNISYINELSSCPSTSLSSVSVQLGPKEICEFIDVSSGGHHYKLFKTSNGCNATKKASRYEPAPHEGSNSHLPRHRPR